MTTEIYLDDLSEDEKLKLLNLVLNKELFLTKAEQWRDSPNQFIALSIPDNIIEFVEDLNDKDNILSTLISELICHGIAHLANNFQSYEDIDQMIEEIIFKKSRIEH